MPKNKSLKLNLFALDFVYLQLKPIYLTVVSKYKDPKKLTVSFSNFSKKTKLSFLQNIESVPAPPLPQNLFLL